MTGRYWLLGGGIGCGKSTVREMLSEAGVATIDADSLGHRVLDPDGPAFASVATRWPEVVSGGLIDRGALAGIVFSDPAQLAMLESLTHPHIFGMIEGLLEDLAPPVVVEIPLLGKRPEGVWARVVVDCEDETRLRRLVARGMTDEQARARMGSQPSRAEWLAVADLVIPNHGDRSSLRDTVTAAVPAL
ncbi:MAG: dephospho-CoA kinase [Actinobacteria bacterium]|nr:dephospho-CoA kinase [Actinomycetota bacterium]